MAMQILRQRMGLDPFCAYADIKCKQSLSDVLKCGRKFKRYSDIHFSFMSENRISYMPLW